MSNNRYDYGKITLVKGVIETADGNYSEFTIATDGAWQQWGASTERLGHTTDAMEAMARALMEDDLLATDAEEDEEEETYDLALLVGVRRDHVDRVGQILGEAGYRWFNDRTGWRVWSEPVDEDENDGVTYLVHIAVESLDQGRAVAIMLDQAGLSAAYADVSPEWQRELIEAGAGPGAMVLGFVTNADTYCEGFHHAIVRGAEPVNLLGR